MKKKRLFIVGAGGLGRDMETFLDRIPSAERDWEVQGYIDECPNALDGYPSDYKILGDIDSYPYQSDDLVLIAVANPTAKIDIYNRLKNKVTFFTYIDPGAVIGKYNHIGEGSIILSSSRITTNVTIGKLTTVLEKTLIGHDVMMGDFCSIMPDVDIGGGCEIGSCVYIGTKAVIAPRRKVKDNVTVGTGSVVIRNVIRPCTVFGNPAVRLESK